MVGCKPKVPKGYFSPRDAAVELRCTVQNVRSLRQRKIMGGKFVKAQNMWVYSFSEVAEAKEYLDKSKPIKRGELTARAFDMFAEGGNVADVVRKLRITTMLARSFLREFDPGYVVLGPDDVARLRTSLNARGMRARSGAELLDALDRLCARDALLTEREVADA